MLNGRKRRHGTLFEAMSRAPITQPPARPRGLLNWKKAPAPSGPSMMVAEPLTEEQAAQALAAEQAERDRIDLENRARDEARAAQRAEKQARRAERKALRAAAAQQRRARREEIRRQRQERLTKEPFKGACIDRGRLLLALDGPGLVLAAAGLCLAVIGAYTAGQRLSSKGGEPPSKVAALLKNEGPPSSPSQPGAPQTRPEVSPTLPAPVAALTGNPATAPDSEMLRLVSPPPARQKPQAAANPKERLSIQDNHPADAPRRVNHFLIESFPMGRDTSPARVLADVAHARKFLADQGIRTVGKRLQTVVRLYSEQTFEVGSDPQLEREREKFRKKIEALGLEYRRQGGNYRFQGCDFVSASFFKNGQPLE